jgi:hypothetical protein
VAFWEEVRIEVAILETQERLGLDEERLAPLEALHEDLYFGLLAFVQAFNSEQKLKSPIQLGRIVPVTHPAPRNGPWARLSVRSLRRAVEPCGWPPRAEYLCWRRGHLVLGLSGGDDLSPGQRRRLTSVAEVWGHRLELGQGSSFEWSAPFPRPSAPPSVQAPRQAPPQDRILSGDEVRSWTRRLGSLAGLRAWRAGRSWQGREILALESCLPATGCISVGKLRMIKPTLLLNARHHANEVSSSNAALALAWNMVRDPGKHRLLQKVNLVMVPLENADGVATLEELLPGAPDQKLHAARFNALGQEWYAHYFDHDPPFPEARVKTRLYHRWLPRLLMEAHGVPSHECFLESRHIYRYYWLCSDSFHSNSMFNRIQ